MGAGPAADGSHGSSCGTDSRHWRRLPQLLHIVAARCPVPRTQAVHGEFRMCHAAHAGLCCVLFQLCGRRGNAAILNWSPRLLGTPPTLPKALNAESPARILQCCLPEHTLSLTTACLHSWGPYCGILLICRCSREPGMTLRSGPVTLLPDVSRRRHVLICEPQPTCRILMATSDGRQ